MSIRDQMVTLAREAKDATRILATLSATVKNDMLQRMAAALEAARPMKKICSGPGKKGCRRR
jgi:glutamate-5-semialdehyde dehydrogenase